MSLNEYSTGILHEPKEPTEATQEVAKYISKPIRVQIDDGRTFTGKFSVFDKFGNLVINEAVETYKGIERTIKVAVVPLSHTVKVEVKCD